MEKTTFQVTLKDIIFLVSLVFTVAGTWYSQTTRIREMELRFEAQKAINDITMEHMKGRLIDLTAQVESLAPKKRIK